MLQGRNPYDTRRKSKENRYFLKNVVLLKYFDSIDITYGLSSRLRMVVSELKSLLDERNDCYYEWKVRT